MLQLAHRQLWLAAAMVALMRAEPIPLDVFGAAGSEAPSNGKLTTAKMNGASAGLVNEHRLSPPTPSCRSVYAPNFSSGSADIAVQDT